MRAVLFLLAGLCLSTPGFAQRESDKFEDKAEGVVSQPLRDVGIMSDKIPDILIKAQQAPYSRAGLATCADYKRTIAELDEALGPDVDAVDAEGRPISGRLAEAGAKSVVGSLIPFRGLVREISGAASTDRRIAAAYVTGAARRAYLKGYAAGRRCKL